MKDIGIVFIRKSGTTYTKWYSQEININHIKVIPFPVKYENYASNQSLDILKFYHNVFGHDRPIAVVREK